MRKISQMLGAILGGVVGLALGYIVVYAITGNDLFGLLTRHKATAAMRAAIAPPTIKATPLAPPPVRESETTTATLVGAVEPSSLVSESVDPPTRSPSPPTSSPSSAEPPSPVSSVE